MKGMVIIMEGNIIKNRIEILGTYDNVQGVIKKLKDGENKFSFNRIIPIEQVKDDDDMDEYICACINLYMRNNKITDGRFINTCKFIGITRRHSYNFQLLDDDIVNKYKKKYKTKKMIEDAQSFLNKIKSKAILNGALIRDASWGTVSEPVNLKVTNNRFEFDTYFNAPLKVVKQLALSNPDVTISYTYVTGKKVNKISLKGERMGYEIKTEVDEVNVIDEIKQNVFI